MVTRKIELVSDSLNHSRRACGHPDIRSDGSASPHRLKPLIWKSLWRSTILRVEAFISHCWEISSFCEWGRGYCERWGDLFVHSPLIEEKKTALIRKQDVGDSKTRRRSGSGFSPRGWWSRYTWCIRANAVTMCCPFWSSQFATSDHRDLRVR